MKLSLFKKITERKKIYFQMKSKRVPTFARQMFYSTVVNRARPVTWKHDTSPFMSVNSLRTICVNYAIC